MEEDGEPAGVERERFLAHCEGFLREALRGGRWAFFVTEIDGEVVANAFVQVVPKVPRPGRFDDALGYLTNVYVRAAHRNRGLGTELLSQVMAWARARDLEILVVWPSQRSRSLYARAGFAPGEVQEVVLRPE